MKDHNILKLLVEEERKLNYIKSIVDEACLRIVGGKLDADEARRLAASVRARIAEIIPDMMDRYDMIYGSRFERLIQQFIERKKRWDGY